MSKPPSVPVGFLALVLTCPRCGEHLDAGAHLGATLAVDENGDGFIRAKLKAKPVDHLCGQIRLAAPDEDQPPLAGGDDVAVWDPATGSHD